jgi:hypothetical protein
MSSCWRRLRRLLGIGLLPLLASCGNVDTADNHGFGFDSQATSAITGIHWKATEGQPALSTDMVDAEYTSLATCAMASPLPVGPYVIYAPDVHARFAPADGVYFDDTHTAAIDTATHDLVYMTRHELLHHLLKATTGDADSAHQSPLWSQCAPILP